MTSNNLCSSCTNIGCEFQSGIVRAKCAFYMPPHIETDNCGNYIVMQPTAKTISKDELPSAFGGMTNGEVIQALFPKISVYEHGSTYSVNNEYNFNATWWNAPYQKGGEE